VARYKFRAGPAPHQDGPFESRNSSPGALRARHRCFSPTNQRIHRRELAAPIPRRASSCMVAKLCLDSP